MSTRVMSLVDVDSAAMVYLPVMAAHVFRFSEGDSELCLVVVVVVVDLSPHEGTSECWIGWHGVRSLPLSLILFVWTLEE